MHEPVTHCKEGNPFVMIPASLSIVAATIAGFHGMKATWQGIDGVMVIPACIFVGVIVSVVSQGFFIEFLFNGKTVPNTIYIQTKSARIWLVLVAVASVVLLARELMFLKNPDTLATFSAGLFALSLSACMLLLVQIVTAVTIDVPNKIKQERQDAGDGYVFSVFGAVIASISLAFNAKGSFPLGDYAFLLFSLSSVALLWLENEQFCIAEREVTPLAICSLAWMTATFGVYFFYGELAGTSFAMPYFAYLAPISFLGAYYYITKPEKA
jgi:hypothetical protein